MNTKNYSKNNTQKVKGVNTRQKVLGYASCPNNLQAF